MNTWEKEFSGKKIAIFGFGREGQSTLRTILKYAQDVEITIIDQKEIDCTSYDHVSYCPEQDADFSQFDLVLKAPGIVVDHPLPNMVSQTDLFLKHYRQRTIGITGTKGKSTTTTLVYHLLKNQYPMVLVGNIGVPCFEAIEQMENGAYAAFEISCHQLEYCPYSPHIAVFLNLYEEHLDHYGSLQAYAKAKSNISRYQNEQDLLIYGESAKPYIIDKNQKKMMIEKDFEIGETLKTPLNEYPLSYRPLLGRHNLKNMAVAICIAQYLGLSNSQIEDGLHQFSPLEHRLENVGTYHGITYINDSISTIPQSCISAIESLDHVGIVLVGGMDRGIDYTPLQQYIVEHPQYTFVLMYATGKRIAQEMTQKYGTINNIVKVEDLKAGVGYAKKHAKEHELCVLSPAASSYDHFQNFEERGQIFKKMVKDEI